MKRILLATCLGIGLLAIPTLAQIIPNVGGAQLFLLQGLNLVSNGAWTSLAVPSGGSIGANANFFLTGASSGKFIIQNDAANAGVTVDVTTDGTINFFNRAGTASTGNVTTGGFIGVGPVLFAALGTPANGTIRNCTDCTPTTAASCPATKASCVCAGSGSGAIAVRVNGVWDCALFQ